jgi:hypothetical protein
MEIVEWIATQSGDKLPQFSRMTDDPDNITDEDKLAFVAPFRRIFLVEHFTPLLIEIAAIEDDRQRAATPEASKIGEERASNFVSNIVSYLDPLLRDSAKVTGNPLLEAWHTAINDMNSSTSQNGDRIMCDFVPHPSTYKHIYLVWPLTDILPSERDLPKSSGGVLTAGLRAGELKGIPEALRHPFAPISSELSLPPIEEVATRFITDLTFHLSKRTSESVLRQEVECLLRQAILVVVPFFRQIDYAAKKRVSTPSLGGNPGGCVFALLVRSSPAEKDNDDDELRTLPCPMGGREAPSAEKDNDNDARYLRRAVVKVSWLLQQAALAEGDNKAEIERKLFVAHRMLLREIAHAVVGPFNNGLIELAKLEKACGNLDNFHVHAEQMRKTRASLRQAHLAVKSIDYLMGLDPEVCQPGLIAKTHKNIQTGNTNLYEVLCDIGSNYLRRDSSGNSRLEVAPLDAQFRNCTVEGSEDAWSVVLQLILKNADEASPDSPEFKVRAELNYDARRWTVTLLICNRLGHSLSNERLHQMNLALGREVRQLDPSKVKATSQGLGLVTVGRILQALDATASFSRDADFITLSIGPVIYHAS